MTLGEAEAYSPTIPLEILTERGEPDLCQAGFDDLGGLPQRARLRFWREDIGTANARVIGCQAVEAGGEAGNEISALVRMRLEAMQQNKFRVPGFTSPAVEDVQIAGNDGP
jgi:hypothetical protein